MKHPDVVAKSAAFIRVLVRVPEGYRLVRRYGAIRPGFLFLDGHGESWGSVSLVPGDEDADVVAARVVAAMDTVLAGEKLPNAGEPGYIGFASDFVPVGDDEAPAIPALAPETEVRVVINRVVPDSPAASAGLRADDVILALDGRKAYGTYRDVLATFEAWRVGVRRGKAVRFIVERGDEVLVIDATPAARPTTTDEETTEPDDGNDAGDDGDGTGEDTDE